MKIPVKISSYDDKNFLFSYDSGESYAYPYFQLRFFCPCASCVDEMSGKRVIKKSMIPDDIRPKSIQLVGRYALQVTWSDNHSTGIYHFDRIYDLCTKFGQNLTAEKNSSEVLI